MYFTPVAVACIISDVAASIFRCV